MVVCVPLGQPWPAAPVAGNLEWVHAVVSWESGEEHDSVVKQCTYCWHFQCFCFLIANDCGVWN